MNPSDVGEVQLTISHETLRRADMPPSPTEPCECCGTPVLLADPVEMVRQLSGLQPRSEPRNSWHEVHDHPVMCVVHLRSHTRERCLRVRAGDPEPVDFDLED